MGEFYEKMDHMLGEVKEVMMKNKFASSYSYMEEIIIARWTKINYIVHCLGFALSSRFYGYEYLQTSAPESYLGKPLIKIK
ncbi:hypothetical protein PIB30_087535, partial [Stylosanthes scabra]|nr:hypothetical protein [Stylosanthes scabra]